MEWGTPVEYIEKFHFKEGIFVGELTKGTSVIVPKNTSSTILIATKELIPKPVSKLPDYGQDYDKKAWAPFKED